MSSKTSLAALIVSMFLFGTAMSASASSQTPGSSATSTQGAVPEIRVAVTNGPPIVGEQNGSLTGFAIDLWNAIATQLMVKTSYQILPDANALQEAMRSKSADLTPEMFITSTRDEAYDFSYPKK